jgi:DNA-binding MarR family transcriptional regulator
MKSAAKISPEAMQVFLKQAALEKSWSAGYLGKALGLDAATAKRIAEEMALAGYVEAVRGKKDIWRNTASGNKLAGVHPPRLTRVKAEELLIDLEDRAAQFAMGDSPLRRPHPGH